MGKLKKLTHTLVVHSLVFSLLIWTVPLNNAQAEDAGLTGDNWAQAAIGITQTVGQQMVNVKQQNAAMMQQAAIMSQMQPKIVPARFFPQCQVPQAGNTPPDGVCDEVQSPMQLGGMMGYQQLAKKYDDLYTEHSSLAQNTPFPKGLQCIEESAKKTDAQMQDKLNTLTAFQNAIKKQMQAFKEQNQGLLDEMKGTNQELNGGANNSIDEKSKDVAGQFSPSCQNMLGGPGGMNGLAKGSGLLGIKKQLDSSVRGPANDFTSNEAIYKKDIDNLVKKMVKKMNGDGIDNFDLSRKDLRGINPDMAARVTETFRGEVESLNKFRGQIKKDIDRTGLQFDMPEFNKDFAVDFEDFRAGAKNFYQKQYVHNCVTGADDTSLGMSAKDILGGLQQKGIRGVGNAVPRYKEALQNILSQDNHIEDKLAQIRALDAQFSGRGEITISYQDSAAKQVTTTPYKLYMDTVKSCQTQFSQDNTFSTSSKGISMKKKVDRIQGYLDRLKKKHDQFVSDAASSITDSLINCNGAEFKAGPKSCNAGTMSPKTSGFCMSHAQKCASTVNNCYNQVQKVVEKKKQVLKSKAAQYNANMGALIAKQEAILKNVQASVGADSEFIKNFFPGANYTFPKDLFVAMPPMVAGNAQGNPFGVDLRGGGDLKSLETLPQKIEQLKQQLAEQKGKVQSAIKDYASKQKSAIKENQSKWKAFAAKCKGTEKAFRQQMAAAEAQKQQDFAKKKGEVGDFCNKFKRLKGLNSAAGCGQVEDLYSDSNKIAAHVSGDVLASIDSYQSMCEGNKKTEEQESEDKSPKLGRMCERKGWDSIKKDILSNVMRKLPGEFSGNKSDIEKFIKEGTPENLEDINKSLANSDFANDILDARDLHKMKGLSKEDYDSRIASAKRETDSDEPGNSDDSPTRKAIKDLADRINNMKGEEGAQFDGMIKNLKAARSVDAAKSDLASLTSAVDAQLGSAERVNQQHIGFIDAALGDAGLDSITKGLIPAVPDQVITDYEGSRDALQATKRNLLTSKIEITLSNNGQTSTEKISFKTLGASIDQDGKVTPDRDVIIAEAVSRGATTQSANEFYNDLTDLIDKKLPEDQAKMNQFETRFRTALSAHKTTLEDSTANTPLGRLKAELAGAKLKLESDTFTDGFEDSNEREIASASDYIDSGKDDLCQNIKNEQNLVAFENCVKDENPTKCERDEKKKLELNEENKVASSLPISKSANGILISLDKDRGLASEEEWSRIGENSSDACEATATDGRSVAGIDLGEFDLATGATPLGGPGTNR
ncbi:MAG: hypothetical protein KC493_14885 [Bacteriovoracaceae bacterium]|nr:hypothetical protein [Bacteriovoracaceae bacterium]